MINEVLHHYEAIQQEEQIKRMDTRSISEKYPNVDLEFELGMQLRRNDGEISIAAEDGTVSHLSRALSESSSQSLRTKTDIKQFDTSEQQYIALSGRAESDLKGGFLPLTFPDSMIDMDIGRQIKLTPKKIVLSEISQSCKSRSGIEYNIKNSSGIISTTLSEVEVSGSSDMTLLLTIIDMINNIRTKHQIIVLDTLNEKAITFAKDYVAFLKQKNDTISIQINGKKTPLSNNYSAAFTKLLKTSGNTSTLTDGESAGEREHMSHHP